jgi:hypothetical protein
MARFPHKNTHVCHSASAKAGTAAFELMHQLVDFVEIDLRLSQADANLFNFGAGIFEVQVHHLPWQFVQAVTVVTWLCSCLRSYFSSCLCSAPCSLIARQIMHAYKVATPESHAHDWHYSGIFKPKGNIQQAGFVSRFGYLSEHFMYLWWQYERGSIQRRARCHPQDEIYSN